MRELGGGIDATDSFADLLLHQVIYMQFSAHSIASFKPTDILTLSNTLSTLLDELLESESEREYSREYKSSESELIDFCR